MNQKNKTNYSRALVEWIFSITAEDIPLSSHEAAKALLLDTFGCALAGRKAPGVDTVITQLCDWGGKPEATVLFSDSARLPMPNAAFANSAMIHALDFDDIYTPGTLHLTSVIVPAMLAVGEVCSADGKAALRAMILGIEMAARIGVAEHSRRSSGGFLPTSLVVSFGVVITASLLLGLTKEQTVNALGINYSQIAGNRQALLDACLTKRLQPAFAVRSALWAVAMAKAGITGAERVFEGEAGYFSVYLNGDIPKLDELLRPADTFAIERVSTKRYPSCGACHPAQIAAEILREEEKLNPSEIERVEIFGIASLVSEPFQVGTNPQVAAQFSAAWGVAHTLLRGPAKLKDYTDEAVRADHEVRKLAKNIKSIRTPGCLCSQVDTKYRNRPQGVIVHTRDGRRLMRHQSPSQTYPANPASMEDAENKFQDCAEFAQIEKDKTDAIVNTIRQIELSSIPAVAKILSGI